MKKITFLTSAIVISSCMINTVIPAPAPMSEASRLGQQVIRELGENVKTANLIFRAAVNENEREDALKNAHSAAQTLLNTLNDIKTYGNDVIKGYNAAQRRQAAINLAELLTRQNSLKIEIENKRMEKMDMVEPGLWDSVKPGKTEAYAQATKELRDLIGQEKSTRLAISNQEAILGREWSNTITLAIQNLIVGSSYGIAYGIDWYFGDRGARLLIENDKSKSMARNSKIKRSKPLTKKEQSAIRSWNHLRKSKLLSKDIITAYQLTQAKELLEKINDIKDDLKNVPAKYQSVLDKVTENSDSLTKKVNRAKTRWLK